MNRYILIFFSFLISCGIGYSVVYTNTCTIFNESFLDLDRKIILSGDINFTATTIFNPCLKIDTSNFVLDCQNYIIKPLYGLKQTISSSNDISNVSVKNCKFNSSLFSIGTSTGYSWSDSFFVNLSFYAGSGINLEDLNTKNNQFNNIEIISGGFLTIEDGSNNSFNNLSIYSGSGFILDFRAVNNTFYNSYIDTSINFYSSLTEASTGNIFYNNTFTNPVNFTSDNWSKTINHFNYSGLGNNYEGMSNSGKICFDSPLNLTCDYFSYGLNIQNTGDNNIYALPSVSSFSLFLGIFLILISML